MKWVVFFLIMSCSLQGLNENQELEVQQSVEFFDYTDQTGQYRLKREIKLQKKKLVSRVKVFSLDSTKELEGTVSVSKLGSRASGNQIVPSILPEISQFKVWYDKKEHFSQLKVVKETRTLEVLARGPNKNIQKSFKLPQARYLCFFSQLPECLKRQNLLYLAAKKSLQIFILWESYPYHVEQLEGVEDMPYVGGMLSLDEHDKDNYRFSLDLGNQILFLQYNNKLAFKGYHWVSQGISAVIIDKES